MHIEPGIVTGAKIALSYATAAGAGLYTLKQSIAALGEKGMASFAARATLSTAAVFTFFQVLPHP